MDRPRVTFSLGSKSSTLLDGTTGLTDIAMSLAFGLLWMGALVVLGILSAIPRLWGPYLLGVAGFIAVDCASLEFSMRHADGPGSMLIPLFHLLCAGIACIAHGVRWLFELWRWLERRSGSSA